MQAPSAHPLVHLWQRLTEPVAAVQDTERRQQARLLASLMVVLFILALITLATYLLYSTPSTRDLNEAPLQMAVVAPVLLLIPYWLCRQGRYQAAAWLIIMVASAAMVLSAGGSEFSDIFFLDNLIVPILIASVFLSIRMTFLVSILELVAVLVLATTIPESYVAYVVGGPFISVLATAALIVVFTHHRARLEALRRAQLQQERNLLHTLINSLPDYIYAKDTQSRFTLANERTIAHLGEATLGHVLGKTDFDFASPNLAANYNAAEQQLIQTGHPLINHEERIFDHASNSYRWVLTNKIPLRNQAGEVIGLVGINRDITEFKKLLDELQQAHDQLERRVEERTAELTEANARLQEQIAQREQAEKQLAEEHNLLRTMIDIMPDSFYVKDVESRFTLVNPAVVRSFGVSAPDDVIGKTDFDFFIQEHAQEFYADERRIIDAGAALVNKEELGIHLSGLKHWWLTTKAPLRDGAGRIIGLVGVAKDITELKQARDDLQRAHDILERRVAERTAELMQANAALETEIAERERVEQALQAQQRFLRQIINVSPNRIFVKDQHGKFALVNQVMADTFNTTIEDLVGKSDADFSVTPEENAAFLRGDQQVFETKTPLFVPAEKMTLPSGEVRWLQTTKVPLFDEDGSVTQILGVSTDITERKRAEDALRASEERYRIISELISDYAYSLRLTPDGEIVSEWITEDSFKRLTGYDHREVDAAPSRDIHYHPDDRAAVLADLQDVFKGKPFGRDYRILTKNGEVRWVHIYRKPIWDDRAGRVVRFYSVAQDITERRQAEAQRLELALEREQFALVSRLVRAISQYFRTALANIETSRFLIQRILPEAERQAVQPKLDTIQNQVITLSEQLENLSAVAFSEDLQVEPCNINTLIEALVAEHVAKAAQKHQTLQFTPATEPVLLAVDGEKIKRAVRHLLMNALLYTPPGGSIDVCVRQTSEQVLIQVSDNGQGIDAMHLPYIFEPFYKIDPALQTELGGVGLGLTVVRIIAVEHKGKVDVESVPGQGSVFTLRLPVSAPNL